MFESSCQLDQTKILSPSCPSRKSPPRKVVMQHKYRCIFQAVLLGGTRCVYLCDIDAMTCPTDSDESKPGLGKIQESFGGRGVVVSVSRGVAAGYLSQASSTRLEIRTLPFL